MTQPYTAIGSWLTLFVCTLDAYDLDGEAFLRDRGINYADASAPYQRVDLGTMRQLWDEAVKQTNDPLLGLKAGTFVTPTTFSALGIALWSSCTIHDLLMCWSRYMHMFSTVAETRLVDENNTSCMTSSFYADKSAPDYPSEYALDATVSALHTLCRSHYHRNFCPLKIEMPRQRPARPSFYEDYFGCPVSFDHTQLKIYYDREEIETPIVGGNPELAKATEVLVAEQLTRMQPDTTIQKVRAILLELLPRGEARQEVVAQALHVSPRTLHRKLEEQGGSFRQLLEDSQRDLAFSYIRQEHLSLGEISFLLGFSSSSNFSRAFKRWTGMSPKEYRRQP